MPRTVARRRPGAVKETPVIPAAPGFPTPVETTKDPLESVPEPLRKHRTGQRILLVDDLELIADDIAKDMRPFYPPGEEFSDPNDGNVIETESDPLKVKARMRAAKEARRPYTAIGLDLRMPGMNGDELLREISQADLLCPVVIISGSHAKGVQAYLFPQVDRLRTEAVEERVGELEGLDRLIGDIKTTADLEGLRRTLARKTDGVPMRFVLKHGPDYSPEALVQAFDAVLLTGEETEWANFHARVANFRPALIDAGEKTEYVEELSQLTKFIAKRAGDFIRKMESEVPEIKETKMWHRSVKYYKELKSREYSTEKLAEVTEDGVDVGAVRRHRIPNILNGLVNHIYEIVSSIGKRPPANLNKTLEDKPELVEEMWRFYDMGNTLGQLLLMPRCLKEETGVEELNSVLAAVPGFDQCTKTITDEKLCISSPGILYRPVLEQPIMNALQHGEAEVILRKRRVADLNDESKRYFTEEQELSEDDYVAEVCVSDNGPGIPAENLDRIFDPNFTTRERGTGFGLYFLRRYIGKLNGTCHVESEVGKGTDFHMYFKLEEEGNKGG